MSTNLPARRLIPRWRRTAVTLEMEEAYFSKQRSSNELSVDVDDFFEAADNWRDTPTVGHLGDALAFSLIPELREEIRGLAQEVVAKGVQATPAQMAIINGALGATEDEPSQETDFSVCNPATQTEVKLLRQVLRVNPSNPLALLDLAQFQLASGKQRLAERSLLSAVALSPNNRLVIRTLSRFYVHTRDPERAHTIVSRHLRTAGDPWLMAAEIALAEIVDTAPRFARRGFKFIRDKEARNVDLSELAGALGGIEMKSGGVRRARDLFRVALLCPNDNVIAQAVTNQTALGLDLSHPILTKASSSAAEVQTLIAWEALDTELAERSAIAWHLEEPFSSRPLQFLTTLYGVRRQYERGINLARRGLIADPRDPTLLANLAYLLADSDKPVEAEAVLRRLAKRGPDSFDSIILATSGLIAMKRGMFAIGDKLYLSAIAAFERRGDLRLASICSAYYSRSAVDTLHPERDKILALGKDWYAKAGCADAAIILRNMGEEVEPAKRLVSARRLGQWVFDEKNNVLTKRQQVTRAGASPLIVIKK